MTELSRFQKDVEVALPVPLKCGQRTRMPGRRLSTFTGNSEVQNRNQRGWQLHCGDIFWRKVWRKRSVRITGVPEETDPAVERLILEDDWGKRSGKLYENEWFGEQELEVFPETGRRVEETCALMGLLHLKKRKSMDLKRKKFEL